jgi:hypothetical protein
VPVYKEESGLLFPDGGRGLLTLHNGKHGGSGGDHVVAVAGGAVVVSLVVAATSGNPRPTRIYFLFLVHFLLTV